jgi:hypothetical protein
MTGRCRMRTTQPVGHVAGVRMHSGSSASKTCGRLGARLAGIAEGSGKNTQECFHVVRQTRCESSRVGLCPGMGHSFNPRGCDSACASGRPQSCVDDPSNRPHTTQAVVAEDSARTLWARWPSDKIACHQVDQRFFWCFIRSTGRLRVADAHTRPSSRTRRDASDVSPTDTPTSSLKRFQIREG